MNDLIRKQLKKLPGAHYLYGNFVQYGKINATFITYKANFQERPEFEITKINPEWSLYGDRKQEIMSFFGVSESQLFWHFLRNGTPNTNYYRQRLEKFFEIHGTDETSLKRAYEFASFMYTCRCMLRYHQYSMGLKVIEISEKLFGKYPSELKLLDYGCGVADPSLYLALHGANAVVVDLADKKFEFVKSRFKRRNLFVKAIEVHETECPIDLQGSFDVILMAEFLEHVRYPKRFLTFALEHLEDGGLFYDSVGTNYHHGAGGQHLLEAEREMNTPDYRCFFQENFQPVNKILKSDHFDHFYIKRKS
jgi:SAM-dependent methyltransferase